MGYGTMPDDMLTENILALLVAERDKLNRAIEALEGTTKRRGRPPQTDEPSKPTAANNGRAGMSAAARRAQSKRMKAYWSKRRKEAAK